MRQALADLGLDQETCARIGIRVFKVGMVWPLEAQAVRAFADGLEEILVVEEKRQLIEYQIKEDLYAWIGTGRRIPRVIGKFRREGRRRVVGAAGQLGAAGALGVLAGDRRQGDRQPHRQARAAVGRAGAHRGTTGDHRRQGAGARPAAPGRREEALFLLRLPAQHLDRGARGLARRGWHRLPLHGDLDGSQHVDLHADGGEGVPWIGQAPFTDEKHIFANLGDGTYFHSGALAIRAAVAAGVPITYKILFNDAVAMTGGQPTDGQLTVPAITQQVYAEGVRRIVIVTDEPTSTTPAPSATTARSTRVAPRATPGSWHPRDRPPPRPARPRPARAARVPRRVGAGLRPDLRLGEASPAQAEQAGQGGLPRSAAARGDQRTGLRGLRRLQRAEQLPVGRAAGDRVRPQAAHSTSPRATRTSPA